MIGRFASRATALRPARGYTPRTSRLLNSQEGGGAGDTSPERVRARGPLTQRILAAAMLFAFHATDADAAGSGLPWEAPLQRILESIEGPVAKVVAVIIIIVTGLSLAFGDMGGGFRRLIQVVFGLSIAFAATSFFLSFFSFAGGALIN